jgi:cytochrome P450
MEKQRPLIDFDHHSLEYARRIGIDPTGFYRELRRERPIAWSDKHGGFWIVSSYEDVRRVSEDDALFSSRHDLPHGDGVSFTGITIPGNVVRSTPIEMDPPEFFDYRRMVNRWFAPAAIERLKPTIEEYTTWCLDQRIETGRIDFVMDLASPLPAMMTLHVLGVPVEHWREYAEPSHAQIYTPPDSPEIDKVRAGMDQMRATMEKVIAERKREPRDDFISYLINARINDQPLPDSQLLEICGLIIAGGVDTTTSLLANAIEYLDRNPAERGRLSEDPELIASACEEFLRYYCPVQTLGRTATKDVELHGYRIRAGERVLICWAGANHDEAAFEHPEQIVFDRFPNRHTAFGLGIHRCLGSNFARAEFAIMLGEVLRRMPDYRLVREGVRRYESIGIVNGYVTMPAVFSPGRRLKATAAASLSQART